MRRACISLCVLFSVAAAEADDWPRFRGANIDDVVTEKGLLTEWPAEGLKKLWSAPLGDGGGGTFAGAAVVGGKVFVPGKTRRNDVLYCLDAATGAELWKFQCATQGELGMGTGCRAVPTVKDGKVYVLNAYGVLWCLDAAKGEKLWERDIVADYKGTRPVQGMSQAPLIEGEIVVSLPGGPNASVVALDRNTGKEIWKTASDKCAFASPQTITIAGVRQVLCYTWDGLVAIEPKDGKEFWRFPFDDPGVGRCCAMPLVVGDTLVVSNPQKYVTAVKVTKDRDAWKADKLWDKPEQVFFFSSPVPGDGCFYYQDSKGHVVCMDLKDGAVRWSVPNVGKEHAGLVRLSATRLLATCDNGEAVLIEGTPAAGRELARFRAVEKKQYAYAPAAVADGRLFVRDDKTLTCFDLKSR